MTDVKLQELKEFPLLENLTGGQIQECLDYLLLMSIGPIVLNSDLFDEQIAHLLVAVSKNRKRKLSSLQREEFITLLCTYLVTKDRERKLEILETAKVERSFVYNFVIKVLGTVETYMDLAERLQTADATDRVRLRQKQKVIERNLGMTQQGVYRVHLQSRDYLELMFEFRNFIVGNYVKFAYKQAKIYCQSKTNTFDFHDVCHNFLSAIIKSIDKYDCSKGALTSYIKWWILNVQTSATLEQGHEYGIVYTIPNSKRKDLALGDKTITSNFCLSLDSMLADKESATLLSSYSTPEAGLEDKLEENQEMKTISYLIKKADCRKGIARLYLDLNEFFSKKEKRKMIETMKVQGVYDPKALQL